MKENIEAIIKFKPVYEAVNRGGPTRQAMRQILNFYNPVVRNTNQLYEYIRLAAAGMTPALLKSSNRNVYSLTQGLEMVDNLETMWLAGTEQAGNMRDLGITDASFEQTRAALGAIFLKENA